MSDFKSLVGKRMSKKERFMDFDVIIYKLSVAQVMAIQDQAKEIESMSEDEKEKSGFGILITIMRSAVEGADELTDAEFEGFPMEELSLLSDKIMKFSGVNKSEGK
jgi:hypothetical protein